MKMKNHKEDSLDHQAHEHENTVNQLGGFAAGVLLGGLAGATTMLLLAPQSGKRTRTQIQRRSMDLKDQATEVVDDAVAQTRDRVHRMKTGAQRNMGRLQHRAELVLEEQTARVADVVEAGKQAVRGSA
jgi:gas vesicle protein